MKDFVKNNEAIEFEYNMKTDTADGIAFAMVSQ